ncbi:MAG: helix-turn-helix transcriptional regulator [Bacillota bacterium]
MAKADNLLAVLWLLRSRRLMTAEQLADALETSVRTIYRYIDSLSASGVPIVAEPGHDGGYSLAAGFQAAPLIFSPVELKALFHAARFAEQGGYPHSEALEGALRKVRSTFTPAQAEHLEREASALTVVPLPRGGPVEPWLEQLEQAVSEGATLRLLYHKLEADAPEVRVVDPYGLAA